MRVNYYSEVSLSVLRAITGPNVSRISYIEVTRDELANLKSDMREQLKLINPSHYKLAGVTIRIIE